jgi:hypothetical protein
VGEPIGASHLNLAAVDLRLGLFSHELRPC